jgi:hypothetical protein
MSGQDRKEPAWRRYLRLWGRDPDADVADELSFHLEERTAWNESLGLEPGRARAAAEQRFGDVRQIREQCVREHDREMRRMELKDRIADLLRDVRMAVRSLGRAPVYAATAGLALALGIGASAAVFTMVRAVVLRPLPFAAPESVMAVYNRWEVSVEAGVSAGEFLDLGALVRAFEEFGV